MAFDSQSDEILSSLSIRQSITGARKSIDSGLVNEYLRNISKINFTAKDFRTWNGTLCALEAFLVMEPCKNVTQTKKKILKVLDVVA